MKINLLSALVLTGLGMGGLTPIIEAADYNSATEAISDVSATIILGENGGPEIPEIPGFPPLPEEKLPENPSNGPLSLRYISSIQFGDISISTEDQHISAKEDTNGAFPMVTVQDFRGDAERDGWQLLVKQENELLPGAQISLQPSVNGENDMEVEVPSNKIILNEVGQVFAKTKTSANAAGIQSIPMGTVENGVELLVPKNTPVGDYTTKISWNLVNGPVAPPEEA